MPSDLTPDGDGAVEEVDVLDAEAEKLAETQSQAGLRDHHGLVAPGRGSRELAHLGDRERDTRSASSRGSAIRTTGDDAILRSSTALADGLLVRTLPASVPPALRRRLHGRCLAGSIRPVPAGPQRVQRRVSSRGVTQVAGQTLRVGFAHRHTTVDSDVHETEFRVYDQARELLVVIARTSGREVTRTKASGCRNRLTI